MAQRRVGADRRVDVLDQEQEFGGAGGQFVPCQVRGEVLASDAFARVSWCEASAVGEVAAGDLDRFRGGEACLVPRVRALTGAAVS
jgi:hypothetical protein